MSNESVTTGGLYEAVEDIGLLFYLGTPASDQKNNLIRNLILFSSIEKPEIIGLPGELENTGIMMKGTTR
jgi:hypothetical protein